MKKNTKRRKYIRHMRRRAMRAAAARSRFKSYLLKKHRNENAMTPEERDVRRRAKDRVIRRNIISAPIVLSFVRNPEGVSQFISRLNSSLEQKRPVWVSLKDVKEIDYDGITVLLSVIVRFKALHIPFNGDRPIDATVARTLEESRFFDYLYNRTFRVEETYNLTSLDTIVTHAMKTVDSELGERIIESA